jgi:hypothetical protein
MRVVKSAGSSSTGSPPVGSLSGVAALAAPTAKTAVRSPNPVLIMG